MVQLDSTAAALDICDCKPVEECTALAMALAQDVQEQSQHT